MSKKKTWIIVSISASVVILGLGCYVFCGNSVPDPTLQSKTAIAKYLASDEFSKLSKEEKSKYFAKADTELDGERLPREGLSDAEKKKLRENMGPLMHEKFNNRIKEYFKLSPEEKKAFLDKMAEEMKKRRESGERPPGGPGGGTPGANNNQTANNNTTPAQPPAGPSADRIRNRVENTPPEERAMHAQFMKDMQAYRAAQQKK